MHLLHDAVFHEGATLLPLLQNVLIVALDLGRLAFGLLPSQTRRQAVEHVVDQSLVLDRQAIAVESGKHVHSISLHQLVAIDGIFVHHVQKVTQVCRPVSEGWPRVHDPRFVARLVPIVLIVVELARD